MRVLFLNPPSFEGFDAGAASRWPATREIESNWYPVWLCYPAGMLPDSKVVDAPAHKISIEQTVAMAPDFELLARACGLPYPARTVPTSQAPHRAYSRMPSRYRCGAGPPWWR